MTQRLDLAELTACGAHQRGHFRLSSGLHSGDYLQCALYLAHPARAALAGERLALAVGGLAAEADLVVAPALGGVIIGHEVARALGRPFLFTERSDGEMTLRRGFAVTPGQRVVVVEDVVTTGRSTREVIEVLGREGAEVIGVGAMVDRTGRRDVFAGLPFIALLAVSFPTWDPTQCPLCRAGAPLVKPGSRPV